MNAIRVRDLEWAVGYLPSVTPSAARSPRGRPARLDLNTMCQLYKVAMEIQRREPWKNARQELVRTMHLEQGVAPSTTYRYWRLASVLVEMERAGMFCDNPTEQQMREWQEKVA